ncbi:flavin reductase family protein [Rhodococcus triatomae]|uniref:NADH-FMN oxidoreductase RutF, flavin reductase (DIM6/NTAB) family n=1 Tax=Rhodococcus triatomae TaxID=300028 RepID=A0A1G8PL79_9NOCA|nr:flavin reductase family protein [Rhodococcus triatomae]QNG20135.1 flavin reductase family protein [Rhodococcus triatomae]QNG23949.1 flavin reductase family protein [Rhodococcus triatomae]SDI93142.1 NADH-FMN oxidoreductase RutF, flavin reductase (DIM6/NTAB) family [Rhodococcus triatomae]
MPLEPALDTTLLRSVMSNFCTGVTVITAHDGSVPLGFACQSLTSVSLDPPLVSFCPARTSRSWPRLREVGTLCINVLAHDQRPECASFATSGDDKFAGIDWTRAGNGAPALSGALARIEVTVEDEHDAGDHTIVVARVGNLEVLREDGPLLFYRGGYGRFEG